MEKSKYRRWTLEEENLLKSLYQKKRLTELADIFNRSPIKICCKALRLGLRKDKKMLGKNVSETRKRLFKEGILPRNFGDKNPNWKGNKIGYWGFHRWMMTKYGKPTKCDFCGGTKKIQWAIKKGKYSRNRNDWLNLCVWCHIEYDKTSIQYQKPATEWRKRGSKKLLTNK